MPVDELRLSTVGRGRRERIVARTGRPGGVDSDQDITRAVLDRHGTTYAAAAGIRLRDQPAPLFQLLVLAQLLSARIGADVAVATAGELIANGWTTPQRMLSAA